ncbi:leukocyte elastase inhibitor-like isoform X2 [Narcine bancroftii]
MDSLIAGNDAFASALFTKLNEENKIGNMFMSPLSISVALGMLYLGAKGNTAVEMAKVLHFDTETDVHASFRELMSHINQHDAPYLLRLANRLYGEETYDFLKEFQELSWKYYEAKLTPVSFLKQPEAARNDINTFVENKTEGKIQNLLSVNSVGPATVLVLVNAIYFKGKWEKKFDEKNTYVTPFKLNKRETKSVKMMFQDDDFKIGYIEELKTSVLELPYEQEELSMIVLLPDSITDDTTGLEELEQALENKTLLPLINSDNTMKRNVEVHLPSFKLEDQFNLEEILSAMGMIDAFAPSTANFSGMSEEKGLSVSKVIHKSFVDVNEEGTEAAAATSIHLLRSSLSVATIFKADHPFLFFIKHNKTQSILFFGRYTSPVGDITESGGASDTTQQVQKCTYL